MVNAFKSVTLLLIGSMFMMAYGCNAANKTTADRCVLIDLYGEKGKALVPILDAFAQENFLIPVKSHPINPIYQRKESGEIVAEVSYTIGMGKFGSVLAVFQFAGEHPELLQHFDMLVEKEVAKNHQVTKCSDVPGFGIPEAYR